MISRRLRAAFVAAVTVAALGIGLSRPARAQSTEAARDYAQGLYDEAMTDLGAKRFEAACSKLEQASTLVPEGIGVKLMLAECLDGWGKPARAYAMYQQAERGADAAGQTERKKKAVDRMRALEPRIARLTLSVAAAVAETEGLRVTVNGVALGREQLASPIPLEPGSVTVRASADGGMFERVLDVPAGSTETVTIDGLATGVAKPASRSASASLPAPANSGARADAVSQAESPGMSAARLGGFIVGGIGLALGGVGIGLGASGVLGANQAAEDFTAADRAGDTAGVEQARADHTAHAERATAGWIVSGVGGAALVAGIVMIAAGGTDAEPAGSATFGVSPWVAGARDALGGVTLSGAW